MKQCACEQYPPSHGIRPLSGNNKEDNTHPDRVGWQSLRMYTGVESI